MVAALRAAAARRRGRRRSTAAPPSSFPPPRVFLHAFCRQPRTTPSQSYRVQEQRSEVWRRRVRACKQPWQACASIRDIDQARDGSHGEQNCRQFSVPQPPGTLANHPATRTGQTKPGTHNGRGRIFPRSVRTFREKGQCYLNYHVCPIQREVGGTKRTNVADSPSVSMVLQNSMLSRARTKTPPA